MNIPVRILLFSGLILLAGCQGLGNGERNPEAIRELVVLYTNDEHGYMEGMTPDGGAANLLQLWRENEDFRPDGPFLLLSGGDNWTGPAISTWVEGESMVEVMNVMGYDASAIGNHEFDFGLQTLERRAAQADFPYLSANTVWQENGAVPEELGILPFVLKEVNGLTVGIIGLTTTSTPRTANPANLTRLRFNDYEPTLRETVPWVRALGPDLLFVIAHVCLAQMEALARSVADLRIDLMGAGHCNELAAKRLGDTLLIGGGYHFSSYARVRLRYDTVAGSLVEFEADVRVNQGAGEDSVVAAIVERWQAQFRDILTEPIAWSAQEIDFRSDAFRRAVIDSWLLSYPDADVAITNGGGLREPLPAGEITFADLVNTMPFENNIVAVNIPGSTLLRVLEEGGRPIVGGLVRRGETWVESRSGAPLEGQRIYQVLINSFMYDGGDNFHAIAEADPDGFDTGVHYRQPFVDWLRSRQTSPASPLVLD